MKFINQLTFVCALLLILIGLPLDEFGHIRQVHAATNECGCCFIDIVRIVQIHEEVIQARLDGKILGSGWIHVNEDNWDFVPYGEFRRVARICGADMELYITITIDTLDVKDC